MSVKIVVSANQVYMWNPSTYTYDDYKHLKIVSDDSKNVCNEIISIMDIVSTKITNTIAINVSINSDDIEAKI